MVLDFGVVLDCTVVLKVEVFELEKVGTTDSVVDFVVVFETGVLDRKTVVLTVLGDVAVDWTVLTSRVDDSIVPTSDVDGSTVLTSKSKY